MASCAWSVHAEHFRQPCLMACQNAAKMYHVLHDMAGCRKSLRLRRSSHLSKLSYQALNVLRRQSPAITFLLVLLVWCAKAGQPLPFRKTGVRPCTFGNCCRAMVFHHGSPLVPNFPQHLLVQGGARNGKKNMLVNACKDSHPTLQSPGDGTIIFHLPALLLFALGMTSPRM